MLTTLTLCVFLTAQLTYLVVDSVILDRPRSWLTERGRFYVLGCPWCLSAWVAAGALEATDAAVLVRRRGALMYEAGRARPGAMAAVLGLDTAIVERCCAEASAAGGGVVVAANQNAPDQTVISGDPSAVERGGEACKAAGAKRVLPVFGGVGGAGVGGV